MLPKFKIGDRVRCIVKGKLSVNDRDSVGYGWKKGLEFEVKEITTERLSRKRNIYWNGLDENGVFEEWLELAGPKEVKQFGIVKFLEGIKK